MRKSNYGKKPPMSKKSKKIMAGVIGTGILVAVIIFLDVYKRQFQGTGLQFWW